MTGAGGEGAAASLQGLPGRISSSSSTSSSCPDFLQRGMPYPMADYVEPGAGPSGQRVYTGTVLGTGQRVLVRVVRLYGRDAHAAWAAAGLAPQLLQCKRLPGGWYQVEMELLEEEDGWVELAFWRSSDIEAAVRAAQAALEDAHKVQGPEQQVFAHGDARVMNVMVRSKGESFEVKFIDFEVAGEPGKALYPAFINPGVNWPAGVEFGQPLQQEHDTALFAFNCEDLVAVASSGWPRTRP